jgi:hypothetical protein
VPSHSSSKWTFVLGRRGQFFEDRKHGAARAAADHDAAVVTIASQSESEAFPLERPKQRVEDAEASPRPSQVCEPKLRCHHEVVGSCVRNDAFDDEKRAQSINDGLKSRPDL